MDKPYAYMVIERGTRNTYGADTIDEALGRLSSARDDRPTYSTERVDLYALISTDPRDDA